MTPTPRLCTDITPNEFCGLWAESFGQTEADLAWCRRAFAASDGVAVLRADGEALSALMQFDLKTADGLSGTYLYAVCTKRAARGRGCMRALLSAVLGRAKEQGYDFALLLPANDALRRAYTRMGFSEGGYTGTHTPEGGEPQPCLAPALPATVIQGEDDRHRLQSERQNGLSEAAFGLALDSIEGLSVATLKLGDTEAPAAMRSPGQIWFSTCPHLLSGHGDTALWHPLSPRAERRYARPEDWPPLEPLPR